MGDDGRGSAKRRVERPTNGNRLDRRASHCYLSHPMSETRNSNTPNRGPNALRFRQEEFVRL
jgi:hypothetical protein